MTLDISATACLLISRKRSNALGCEVNRPIRCGDHHRVKRGELEVLEDPVRMENIIAHNSAPCRQSTHSTSTAHLPIGNCADLVGHSNHGTSGGYGSGWTGNRTPILYDTTSYPTTV